MRDITYGPDHMLAEASVVKFGFGLPTSVQIDTGYRNLFTFLRDMLEN